MANTPSEIIESEPSGAKFYRADLHIHSFGASVDVKEAAMSPTGIVEQASLRGLDIIAITDHDEISNAAALVEAAKGTSLLAIPGVEISTPEGHLLVYFATPTDLETFYGKLTIRDKHSPTSRCQQSMLEVLEIIDTKVGFAILAHIDTDKGIDAVVLGFSPHKVDILSHPALLGIEIKSQDVPFMYTMNDSDRGRAGVARERAKRLRIGTDQVIARTRFSDAHSLARIGRNSNGESHITRVKMDDLTFAGLRIALMDADARVRLEDEIPSEVPCIVGALLEGGFLADAKFHFSTNLNCVIGGRGTGKSTAFEAIRCISDSLSESTLVDSDAWPDVVTLLWRDESGQTHTIVRRKNDDSVNTDNPDVGQTSFPIECYGQGETAETSQRAKTDPGALLKYLDKFTNTSELQRQEELLRQQLLDNQTAIEEADRKVGQIPQYRRLLATVTQQLDAFAKAKGSDIVKQQQNISEERMLRKSISDSLASLSATISADTLSDDIEGLGTLASNTTLRLGGTFYTAIVNKSKSLHKTVTKAHETISQSWAEFQREAQSELKQWKVAEEPLVAEIERKKKELEAKGVRLDLPYIRKLSEDKTKHERDLKTLALWEKKLIQLRDQRATIYQKRWEIRDRIAATRNVYAKRASQELKSAMGDLSVSVKFLPNAYSPDAEAIIQEAMGWRTVQVPRATLLVESLTVPELLKAVESFDSRALASLQGFDRRPVFTPAEARNILQRLKETTFRYRLECCAVSEKPLITVSKQAVVGGKVTPTRREFAKLSLGQQQSVLLALMLSSESSYPLIIDQPEDNLDGEFIYRSLVPVLRRAKERRQIIVVTHNANITVLGDAENIFALKSTSEKGSIVDRGSIDKRSIRDEACKVLEGSAEAFKRRGEIYGHL